GVYYGRYFLFGLRSAVSYLWSLLRSRDTDSGGGALAAGFRELCPAGRVVCSGSNPAGVLAPLHHRGFCGLLLRVLPRYFPAAQPGTACEVAFDLAAGRGGGGCSGRGCSHARGYPVAPDASVRVPGELPDQ